MWGGVHSKKAEGIANGGNLDEAYLDGIYDRIKTSPISLKEYDQMRDSGKQGAGGGALWRGQPGIRWAGAAGAR